MARATGQAIADYARQALGTRYVWGGNDLQQGIDCSGLVQQVFKKFGISTPRVTYDQINVGHSVPSNKLRAGDLVFFDTDRSRRGPDHVGIYIGGGKFIHAPKPGDRVKISSLADSFYMARWMGGRRMPGVVGGSGGAGRAITGMDEAEPAPVRLDAHELAERYGMSYALFKSNKELWGILKDAVADQWTDTRFQAELKNSKWFKTTSSSRRKALLLQKTDPATWRANLEAARVSAQQAAVKMGAVLSGKNLDTLAKNMVTLEWNEAQVGNFLGQYVKFIGEKTLGGMAGAAAKEIKTTAYTNGIKVSDQSAKTNAAYIVRGLTTLENVQGDLRQQAMGTYPAFAEQIAAGANMMDMAQPYITATATELELPETDIDLFHPKVRAAVQRMDGKGQPSPMSVTDYTALLRDDPAWRKTTASREQSMAVGRQVLADMGLLR